MKGDFDFSNPDDGVGQVREQQNALGFVTTLSYDALGRTTAVEDANGHVTTMNYDARGSQLWSQDPLGRFTTSSYDAVGNVTSQIDARNLVLTLSYDALNRPTTLAYQSGRLTTFVYDPAGQRTIMADQSGVTSYVYDAAGRLLSATYPGTGQLTYAYDAVGNRTLLIDPTLRSTFYGYDANNRLSGLLNPYGETTTFLYDALNRERGRNLANGVTMNRVFDADGRTVSLSYANSAGAMLLRHTLTYDPVGNLLTQLELDGALNSFTYDVTDQLTQEVRTGSNAYSRLYGYDPLGNRLTQNADGTLTTSTYDPANQLATSVMGAVITTFTYDGAGNRALETAGGALTSYTWNQDNKMVGLALPDGTRSTLLYAANSDLRRQTTNTSDTLYLRDGQNLLQEIDASSGALLGHYSDFPGYWGGLISVAQGVSNRANRGGFNVSRFDSGRFDEAGDSLSQFYAFDQIGTTRQLFDSAGLISDTLLFTGFGKEVEEATIQGNLFGYAGIWGYLQVKRNVMWVRERVYDSNYGKWLSADPISFLGGDINLFNYVSNRGVLRTDPSGLQDSIGGPDPYSVPTIRFDPNYKQEIPNSNFTIEGYSSAEKSEISLAVQHVLSSSYAKSRNWSSYDVQIILIRGSGKDFQGGVSMDILGVLHRYVYIDMNEKDHPMLVWSHDHKKVFYEATPWEFLIGHELDHAIRESSDSGLHNLDTVCAGDNGVRGSLGGHLRAMYRVPGLHKENGHWVWRHAVEPFLKKYYHGG